MNDQEINRAVQYVTAEPLSLVDVCGTAVSFSHITVSPTFTVTDAGEKE